LEILRLRGSHREIGEAIGAACARTLRDAVAFDVDAIPEGRTREQQLELADRYREITFDAYPWYRDELEGAASAADVDVRALFATVVEEIWYVPYARQLRGRCSDLVAVPPATQQPTGLGTDTTLDARSLCTCFMDAMEQDLPFDEFVAFDEQSRNDPTGTPPQDVLDVITPCLSDFSP